jgi:hypothetical protein
MRGVSGSCITGFTSRGLILTTGGFATTGRGEITRFCCGAGRGARCTGCGSGAEAGLLGSVSPKGLPRTALGLIPPNVAGWLLFLIGADPKFVGSESPNGLGLIEAMIKL